MLKHGSREAQPAQPVEAGRALVDDGAVRAGRQAGRQTGSQPASQCWSRDASASASCWVRCDASPSQVRDTQPGLYVRT